MLLFFIKVSFGLSGIGYDIQSSTIVHELLHRINLAYDAIPAYDATADRKSVQLPNLGR